MLIAHFGAQYHCRNHTITISHKIIFPLKFLYVVYRTDSVFCSVKIVETKNQIMSTWLWILVDAALNQIITMNFEIEKICISMCHAVIFGKLNGTNIWFEPSWNIAGLFSSFIFFEDRHVPFVSISSHQRLIWTTVLLWVRTGSPMGPQWICTNPPMGYLVPIYVY